MNFKTALEGFWIARKRDFSQNTVNDYSHTYRRFAEFIGDQPVDKITALHINQFLNQTKERNDLSDKTVKNMWIALSSFFTWAKTELNVPHPIQKQIKIPKATKPVIQEYTQVEVKAMLHCCEYNSSWSSSTGKTSRSRRPTAKRDQAIICLLVETGIRASELCDLDIQDYDQNRGQIYIRHGKGNKQRMIYIADAAKRYLWRYLASRPDRRPTDPLFATDTNQHMKRDGLLDMISACARRAGVAKANVHKFRHTFAINFLRNGGNLLELKRLLGHEQMETLQIYVELSTADLARAMRNASPADRWRL